MQHAVFMTSVTSLEHPLFVLNFNLIGATQINLVLQVLAVIDLLVVVFSLQPFTALYLMIRIVKQHPLYTFYFTLKRKLLADTFLPALLLSGPLANLIKRASTSEIHGAYYKERK